MSMPPDVPPILTEPDPSGPLTAVWEVVGHNAAEARATGELDLSTAPLLDGIIETAFAAARVVLLDLQGLTFIDAAGLHTLLDATEAARDAGRHLLVSRAAPCVERLLTLAEAEHRLMLLGTASTPSLAAPPVLGNPVNARVMTARVMAVPGPQLWLHHEDGLVQRAWSPGEHAPVLAPGEALAVYLRGDRRMNGWWHPGSGLAVNVRLADEAPTSTTGVPVACQGRCGLVWQAPAGASLLEHDERCLTCGGPLALA